MLNSNYFYHNTTRKLVTVFGDMFNDIVIRRFDAQNNKLQNLPVPIAYAGKQKYITQNARNNENDKIQMFLPRMGFIISNFRFVPERKINPVNKNRYKKVESYLNTQFVPYPVAIDFELSILVRSEDDGFQIIEQICPYFTPSFTNSIKLFPEMGLEYDCRTIWDGSINITDDYEGTSEESRTLTYTLNFTMETWYAGPISASGVIKRVQVDLIPSTDVANSDGVPQSRIVITPGLTADGKPTTDPGLTIPYSEINADDPYGYITTIDFFQDGIKRT